MLAAFAGWFEAAQGPLSDRIRALFDNLARAAAGRRWRGCGFLRTAAELVETPGHPAVREAAAHKKRLEAWFAQVLAEAGLKDAAELARQIVLLVDGAFSVMLVHHDFDYIRSAGAAAARLVQSSLDRLGR